MANFEVKINAIHMADFKRQINEWATIFDLIPAAEDFDLNSLDLTIIIDHLQERLKETGLTVDIKTMIDEVVEVKAPKAKRQKAAPVETEALTPDQADDTLEALKQKTIRRLQEKYLEPGGKAQVDALVKKYGKGEKVFSKIPAAVFPDIAEELENDDSEHL